MPDIKPPIGAKAPPQTKVPPPKPAAAAPPPPPKDAGGQDKDKEPADKKDEKAKKKLSLDIKGLLEKPLYLLSRFQIPIITIAIFGLLAFTALRMLNYSNPAVDDLKVQENLSKTTKVRIDPKSVERIKALAESNVSTGTNVVGDRDNPFEEN